jgi:hypothetical protein
MQAVHAMAPPASAQNPIGGIFPVRIVEAHPNSLAGEIVPAGDGVANRPGFAAASSPGLATELMA